MSEPAGGAERDLPAPYRSPWLGLGLALQAVAVSLLLAWRRLWRRNRQGDLPRPPFWPAALAPLFWPLLLSLPLLLLVGGLLWGRPDDAPPEAATPEPPPSTTSPAAAAPEPAPPPAAAPAAEEGGPAAVGAVPSPPDPLLQAFSPLDPDHWIVQAEDRPAQQQLSLVLAADFAVLPLERRRQLAASWCRQADQLGYDHLLLRDRQGRLLGRNALVGSGMILLDDGNLS